MYFVGIGALLILLRENFRSHRCDSGMSTATGWSKFHYWPRYVARLLRVAPSYHGPYLGWRLRIDETLRLNAHSPSHHIYDRETRFKLPAWHYSENPPWNLANRLFEYPYNLEWTIVYPDGFRRHEHLDPVSRMELTVFKGDRVKVLRGPDKGRTGLVLSVIPMRRACQVEGLQLRRKVNRIAKSNRYEIDVEHELIALDDVALLDPVDGEVCQVEWRYDQDGRRLRVSSRSGYEVPLPHGANILDEGVDPRSITIGPKDTPGSRLKEATFKPSLRTFEEEILDELGIKETRAKQATFWY